MSAEDGPDTVVHALDPRVRGDVMARVPHERAAEEAAHCHRRDVVACQRIAAAVGARDQPELGQHRHDADEEAGHPERVEERPRVHVRVEQRGEDQGDQDEGAGAERVLGRLVAGAVGGPDVVEQPEDDGQRGQVEGLVDPVTGHVNGEVTVEPGRGREPEAQRGRVQQQRPRGDAGGAALGQHLQRQQRQRQALEDHGQRQHRGELAPRRVAEDDVGAEAEEPVGGLHRRGGRALARGVGHLRHVHGGRRSEDLRGF
mmetsp:Transcript_49507/g.119109  ORF Transcript_49507/g.119109 Transcript_49507/m.119109 type:complete len:258 (+) Transcript_49507:209-982(+)